MGHSPSFHLRHGRQPRALPNERLRALLTIPPNNWVYDLLCSIWNPWIGSAAADSTSHRGAYSAQYADGPLRIISLNTNMWYVQNYWLYQPDRAVGPDSQNYWLASDLDDAEKKGERAYIIGHVAPYSAK